MKINRHQSFSKWINKKCSHLSSNGLTEMLENTMKEII